MFQVASSEFSDESSDTTSDEESSALDFKETAKTGIFEAIVHQLSAEDFTIFWEDVLVQWVVVTFQRRLMYLNFS